MHRSIRLMSILICLCLISLPGLAFAQQPGQIDPAEMMRLMQQDPAALQRMAQQAQAAQQCLKSIDQKKVDALKTRAEAASREVQRLCDAGKKAEALSRGLALTEQLRSDPTFKKLQECTKSMAEMFKDMPWSQMPGMNDESPPTEDDVCS